MKPYVQLLILFLFTLEIFSLLPSPSHEFAPADAAHQPFLLGAIHVHSNYSGGTGTIPEIAAAAKKAGMNFVIVTDLDTSKGRRDGLEKSYDEVDAFVEMEVSTPSGHALSFYSASPLRNESDERIRQLTWAHILGHENPPGFFALIAHPSNPKTPWSSLDRFPEGVEVINFDSSWRRLFDESLLGFSLTLMLYPFNNYLAATRFAQLYPKDFSSLDAVNAVTPGHFGILGHDTRARLKLNDTLSIPWPSYGQSFRMAANVIFYSLPLASDFAERKKQIYESLRLGRNAIVFSFIHPFTGNDSLIRCGERSYRTGEVGISGNDKCEYVVQTPSQFRYPILLKVWKNGELFKSQPATGASTTIPIDGPGSYRLEVWAKMHTLFRILANEEVPYVLYNSIYLR